MPARRIPTTLAIRREVKGFVGDEKCMIFKEVA
jgi:hypothetical protein